MALCLDKDRPARSEPAQRVVEAAGNGNKFGWNGGIEIGSAKLRGPLKRAVLVEDDALVDQCGPWQKIRKARVGTAIFGKIHHWDELTR